MEMLLPYIATFPVYIYHDQTHFFPPYYIEVPYLAQALTK